ncbi:MAG: hypothetical protein ACYDD1_21110 [Caulobacteraceae bacterium]
MADGHLFDRDGVAFARVKDGHVWIDGKVVADERGGDIFVNGTRVGTLMGTDQSMELGDEALIQRLKNL